jgi:adenylate kinase family enzyme
MSFGMAHASARIHIVGASGSGTTTLGAALARQSGRKHLDTDDVFWLPTDPPFTATRPVEERLLLMERALDGQASWLITGSLMGWGDVFIPRFDLVVFLYAPPDVRIARLLERERRRYGPQIDPGGRMYDIHKAFMDWARSYDDPDFDGRSLARHRKWLRALPCPVVEIAGTPSLDESLARILSADLPPMTFAARDS